MRVLIVNTSERTGGAAVAASRLAQALINNGVKAKMLVMEKQTDAPYVTTFGGGVRGEWHFLWERFVIWVHNCFSRRYLFAVSIANAGTDITQTAEFREADVIHLHWINQGMLSLKQIRKILVSGKSVVWTMHDMWPLTAICHHSHGCERYQEVCAHCPFLRRPGPNDLSHKVFSRKQRMLEGSRVHFVAVSQWLAARARRSALIGQQPLSVVPNTIRISHFPLIARTEARRQLNIAEPYALVFGAARIDDRIKGFSYLLQALRHLLEAGTFRSDELRLQLFGGIKDETLLQQIPIPYTYHGYVNDEQRLATIYAASNAVVSSSLYETFGQTLIEAQACGCVPVAFDGSGQADIICHQENGYLAKRLSAESLAEGIAWGLKADIPASQLRAGVTRHFSESVVAAQYIKVYEQARRPQVYRHHDTH